MLSDLIEIREIFSILPNKHPPRNHNVLSINEVPVSDLIIHIINRLVDYEKSIGAEHLSLELLPYFPVSKNHPIAQPLPH